MAVEVATPDFYTRHGNPNHVELADAVATLEGAERGLVFASGMGALTTAVLALVRAGDHVVAQRSMYGGSLSLVQALLPRLGVDCTLVDQTDVSAWADAVTPATRLFLIESPSNPRLEITDIAAVAAIARERGIVTLADNTFATPVNQRPIELGVDLVWHSATKYLAGHSDTSAGVVVGPEAPDRDDLEHVADGRRGARPVRRLARDTRDPHAAPARRAPQHDRQRSSPST